MPLVLGRSGTQYVAMVTKLLSSKNSCFSAIPISRERENKQRLETDTTTFHITLEHLVNDLVTSRTKQGRPHI